MAERVTVAVAGGPASEAALSWVLHRARSGGQSLEVVTVSRDDDDLPEEVAANYRASFEADLESARARADAAGVPVTTTLLHGSIRETLIEHSARADLLVVGTSKSSTRSGISHGVVSRALAGQSACPVVVVPAGWAPRGGPVVVGWTTDGTSDAALDFGAAEAARTSTPLVLVHTWSAPPLALDDAGGLTAEEVLAAERRSLSEAAERVRVAHPALTVSELARSGPAASAIVRAGSDASLVVVGSRGRGPVLGFLLGSVSRDVLANMPAPVAVVPPEREVDVYPELVDTDA